MPYTELEIARFKERADASIIEFFEQAIPTLLAAQHPSLSVEKYLENELLSSDADLYNEDERRLIADISKRFKRVRLGFAYFSLLAPDQRPNEALRLTADQLRTSWQRTGIPVSFNQTVDDHQRSGTVLAFHLFPEYPKVGQHFRYHDTGESVVGDFTPHDQITRTEKAQIESLGVRLATHAACRHGGPLGMAIRDAITLYDGTAPEHNETRRMMKDCDLLEMPCEMIFAMETCPKSARRNLVAPFREFWDYVEPNLSSLRAKHCFSVLKTARDALPCGSKELMDRAVKFMLSHESDPAALSQLTATRLSEHRNLFQPSRPVSGRSWPSQQPRMPHQP